MSVLTLGSTEALPTIIQSGPVVLDFYADWCGPCRMLSAVFEKAANELPDIQFVKINVDEHPDLAKAYGVAGIPNLQFIRDGNVVYSNPGAIPYPALKAKIEEYLR